jgi:hypothetical protein
MEWVRFTFETNGLGQKVKQRANQSPHPAASCYALAAGELRSWPDGKSNFAVGLRKPPTGHPRPGQRRVHGRFAVSKKTHSQIKKRLPPGTDNHRSKMAEWDSQIWSQ